MQIMGIEGMPSESPAPLRREAAEVLEALERGEIGVEEAVRRLEAADQPAAQAVPAPRMMRPRRWWWVLPWGALLAAALGGSLAWLGGWAWLLAAPCLLGAGLLALLAALTWRAPWLAVRVHTGQDRWPRTIRLLLPLPVGLLAAVLKRLPPRWRPLERTALDELLLALEGLALADAPLVIKVDEGGEGEKIEVSLG